MLGINSSTAGKEEISGSFRRQFLRFREKAPLPISSCPEFSQASKEGGGMETANKRDQSPFWATYAAKSTSLQLYPHSLSYQAKTFTMLF